MNTWNCDGMSSIDISLLFKAKNLVPYLLCGAYNEIHKRVMIPSLIISFVLGISVSLLMLMSKSGEKSIQNMLVFGPAGCMSLVVVLFAFQLAVRIYMECHTLLTCGSSWRHIK